MGGPVIVMLTLGSSLFPWFPPRNQVSASSSLHHDTMDCDLSEIINQNEPPFSEVDSVKVVVTVMNKINQYAYFLYNNA